jgi:phospholipase C
MNRSFLARSAASLVALILVAGCATAPSETHTPAPRDPQLDKIGQIVVLYLENRSFDHLFGMYPGADGIANAKARQQGVVQVDRSGKPYAALPVPVMDKAGKPDARLADPIPNGPFRLEPKVGLADTMFSPIHAYYANRKQINGGRNDRFVADGNSGGLTMGYYDGSSLGLWTTTSTSRPSAARSSTTCGWPAPAHRCFRTLRRTSRR